MRDTGIGYSTDTEEGPERKGSMRSTKLSDDYDIDADVISHVI